jgi:putative transcriptional regulator
MPSDMAKRVKRQSARQGEAKRDVWQEVLDGVREIRAGGGRRTVVTADSPVAQIRLRSGLSQEQFAAALGVSKRTLEQWEQGRRRPSGAARTLLKIVDRHPEVLIELAA